MLKIDKTLLPSTTYEPTTIGNELVIAQSTTVETEFYDAAQIAQHLEKSYPDDTTAIIVNSNKDADFVYGGGEFFLYPYYEELLNWSELNKARCKWLIKNNLMTESGLKILPKDFNENLKINLDKKK